MIREYIGCIICGIEETKTFTEFCKLDAAIYGIKLVTNPFIGKHHFTIMKECSDWYKYGNGILGDN